MLSMMMVSILLMIYTQFCNLFMYVCGSVITNTINKDNEPKRAHTHTHTKRQIPATQIYHWEVNH